MRKPLKSATMLASLVVVAGCALGYPEEFETIQSEPLADTELLGLRLEIDSGGAGLRGRTGPHVLRIFENPGEPPRRLVARVKEVGVESGWTAESCAATQSLDGHGPQYSLYLTKHDSVLFLASVTANQAELTVEVDAFPIGGTTVPTQSGEPAC